MKNIDYLVGKIKRMICFVFGHRLRPHYKCEPIYPGVDRVLKIKYYKCTRCGKKITITEHRNKQM